MKSQNIITRLTILAFSVITFHSASWVHAEEDGRPSREAMRAAFEECGTAAGIEKPEPGQRPVAPTDEQRASIDACLKKKGIKPPEKFGGRGGHPPGPPPMGEGPGNSGTQ